MIPAKPALIYPLTVLLTFIAFPYPLSPSPMTGIDTASVICCPWSTISPYDMNPVSGNPRRAAEMENPNDSSKQCQCTYNLETIKQA